MSLDIVIPAHNEERRIGRTLEAYRSVIDEPLARFLVALDQCTDKTSEVVRSHARLDARVEIFEYPKLGKGGVLLETFRRCEADFIGFVDADGATPPAEFMRLVDAARSADGAIASRSHPASVLPTHRSLARCLTSLVFAALTRAIFGLPFRDTQCGAKVVRRQVVEQALPLLSARDFLFDVDLLLTAARLGFRIIEVPTVWLDQPGSHLKPVSDGRQMAASSLSLWIHHHVFPVAAVVEADVESRGHRLSRPRGAGGAPDSKPSGTEAHGHAGS